MDITFVKTRYHYDSYIDFFRLVELAGFPTIFVDELDVSKHGCFIVTPMNGEWRPHIQNQDRNGRNSHLVLWNLERPSGSAGSVGQYFIDNRELIYQRYVDEVWVSDARLADESKHACRFVVLGSHPELGEPGADKLYDFTHMSYETNRRQSIYKQYHETRIGPNCWPPERHEVLKKSRFALNIHQDSHPFIEPLRLALFASYGLPILSETVKDGTPWSHDESIIFNTYDGMVGKLNQMLADDYSKWRTMGMRGRDLLCIEYEFGKMVRRAVREIVPNWR